MSVHSLRIRLALLVLAGVVPAIGILWMTLHWERQTLEDSATQSVVHAARLAALGHRRAIGEAEGLLVALARLPEVVALDAERCSATMARIRGQQARYANLGALTLEGRSFCSAVPIAVDVDLSDREWFLQAARTDALAVGGFQFGRIIRKPTVNVALPAKDDAGVTRAFVYASLDLAIFSALIGEEISVPGGEVVVLDGKGTVLARHPQPEAWLGVATEGQVVFDRIRARRMGHLVGPGLEGQEQIFGFAPLASGMAPDGSVLAVALPREAAFADASTNFRLGMVALAGMGVVALGIAWLAAEVLIVRRARQLTDAATRLATGDLGARSRLPYGGDELGQLARAFDEMAASVEELTRDNRLILECTGEGILSVAPDGRVRSANPAAAQLLGAPAEAMVGRCLHDLVHGPSADHPRGACPLFRGSARSVPHDDLFRRADGEPLPVQVISSPLRDGERDGGTAVFFTDMGDRRRLEDQLRQASKMEAVGKLAGGVAHDFNNLLTAIIGYGDLLRMRLGARSPHQRELGEMLRAAHRAAALTRQLLAFSRRQALAPQVVDLNGVVTGLEKMLRRLIGEDVTLELDLARELGRILADPGQIEQVVMNLSVNARDAMPQGGRLTFVTRELPPGEAAALGLVGAGWLELAVTDTGVGMEPTVAARIFEPFFTTKATGTGLGLSMVYGIVQQCGGHVQVDSAPGRGATFRILFPRTEETALADAEPTGEVPLPGKETVLLVEDEPAVRALVQRTLEQGGYSVLEANDVSHAQTLATNHSGAVHLLLTDVIMPGMSGRELAGWVERQRPGIKVLYMSGYTDGVLSAHGVEGVAFLAKPFTAKKLLGRVREVLDGRAEAQAIAGK